MTTTPNTSTAATTTAAITTTLLPLGLLQPSPTNPRKRFTAAPLQTLTDSIAQHALLQPIIVRPLSGATPGQPQYEVVAGERRWRACTQLAAEGRNPHGDSIPALVSAFTDTEVLVVQLAENIQREDLHPLEEGQHYQAMRTAGISLEDIAHTARVGEQRVRQRLQLLQLQPDAQAAFIEGRLTLGLAHQVARLPAHQQREAVQHVSDWGGEPMGVKAAAAFIRDRLMLRLADAPFDTADAALYPAAGACTACPARSGANPQLWADITDADRCANPPCFNRKKAAQRSRLADELAITGYTVHQGDAARDLCTTDGRDLKPGMVSAESQVPHELGDTALKVADVLTRAGAPNNQVHVIDHPSGTPLLYCVATHDLEAALRKLKAHRSQLSPKALARPARQPDQAAAPAVAAAPAAAPALSADAQAVPAAKATQDAEDPWKDHPFTKAIETANRRSAAPALDLQAEPLATLLAFHVPATVAGRYQGLSADAFASKMALRAHSILAAARIAQALRIDGAEGLPQHGLARVLIDLLAYNESHASIGATAGLLGLGSDQPDGPSNVFAWACHLPEEVATRVALVHLALQDAEDTRYINALESALGLDFSDLPDTAASYVQQQMLLSTLDSKPRGKANPAAQGAQP